MITFAALTVQGAFRRVFISKHYQLKQQISIHCPVYCRRMNGALMGGISPYSTLFETVSETCNVPFLLYKNSKNNLKVLGVRYRLPPLYRRQFSLSLLWTACAVDMLVCWLAISLANFKKSSFQTNTSVTQYSLKLFVNVYLPRIYITGSRSKSSSHSIQIRPTLRS